MKNIWKKNIKVLSFSGPELVFKYFAGLFKFILFTLTLDLSLGFKKCDRMGSFGNGVIG